MEELKNNIIFKYWRYQTIQIAQEKKYKYIIMWVDNFIKKIFYKYNLISIEILKKELPIYYDNLMKNNKEN